ncbi:Fic family protein [Streptomyces sp. NBC_01142]|uniref:Fic family protein n=1 Tax=Streptomyces sp. NBC_01142 TaxID=2975865 RepID=UPI0022544301|nr:Fic family protein [Streptomyces sp. NBC_01142]MCX4826821.1 Fic family protein [Streptomyces sp. NBC_01142]
MTADALAAWCHVRNQIDWASAVGETPAPVEAAVDGLGIWCDAGGRYSNPARGDQLLAALAQSRADASRKRPLTCVLLAEWQRLVLGMPEVSFRQGDAFAKGGRERYALTPHTQQDFEHCLRESADPRVPLASRAARAYLDVAFFHPFPDGNARLAMLTLAYVLELEGVRLDQAGPLQSTRYADDAAGAADLAALVSILIHSTLHRATRDRH